MNDLKEKLKDLNLKINSIKYIGNIIIIDSDKGNFVYKDNSNNYDIYDYLKSRGFTHFPMPINNKNSNYEIVEYIPIKQVPNEQKLKDLIYLTSLLHKNTSFNKEIDLDEIKNMYENISNEADYLMNYYHDLNNYIDNITFMSPTEYFLVSNIDLFYYLISFVKVEINNWYNHMKNKKTFRYSMIHNNLSLDHLLENNKSYLISWNKACLNTPIIDLEKIYKDNFYDLDLNDFIKEYEKNNYLDEYEYLYLLIKLGLPKRIEFTNNTYQDTYDLSNYLVYLRKIALLIQKNEVRKIKN